ncbi:MAG: IS66 family transposase [Candidatus Dormiibacterota bacterium]
MGQLVGTYEVLIQEYAERVGELEKLNATLVARIATLEERLAKNSRNSSIPPSADGLSKPVVPNRSQRRAQGRRPGKQPGGEGKHLAQVSDPDEIVTHAPTACTQCGENLADADVVGVEVRQVFDLPRITAFVTEHHMERRRCACGCVAKAPAPKEATAPACYGQGVRSLAVYLAVHQHLPYDRMAGLFNDVLGIDISTGALAQMVAEAGGALGEFTATLADLLCDAPVVHFDETGARVAGRLHWVHVASNATTTLLDCYQRRGKVAIEEMGVLSLMSGIAVHDGFAPYRSYEVIHALCNAHHLRELEGIAACEGQQWADEMIGFLVETKTAVQVAKASGQDHFDQETLTGIFERYRVLLDAGWMVNPRLGDLGGVHRTAANLLLRLDSYRDDVLRFASDFGAPFDNNQAERDIRMVKLQQKISGTWRSFAGARNYCAIRSYISTMKKQDHNVLLGLRSLFEGHAWMPART